MSEVLTGRMRLRPHRQYEDLLLVLQVEVKTPDEDGIPCASWRDGKVEDLPLPNIGTCPTALTKVSD